MKHCSCHKKRSKKIKRHPKRKRNKHTSIGEIALWGIGAITLGKIL